MNNSRPIRVGIMGFGQIGRQIYELASRSEDVDVVAVADIGKRDIFEVDIVIDSTGKFRDRSFMQAHLDNGAPRVLLRTLPTDHIDRIVIPGINTATATVDDRMISAGSATTSALCLLLNSLSTQFGIECGSMTTVHAFTSDQALQDYAGSDFRRSRSAAKNIIPNTHEASLWLGQILPEFDGKILTSALNVPVHLLPKVFSEYCQVLLPLIW